MRINISDTRSNELLPLDQLQHFCIACWHDMRKPLQPAESDMSIFNPAYRQFPDDEWMTKNLVLH